MPPEKPAAGLAPERPTVLLATFQLLPEGEPGGDLIAPFADRGVDARWVCWDDPDVEWSRADMVVVRSTWDYPRRHEEFLAWARGVEQETPLLNGADLFAWNADKAYLLDLAEFVPVVPTELIDDASLLTGVADALTRWNAAVIKPRVGAGGRGVVAVEEPADPRLMELAAAPWLIQPLVDSVRSEGEKSLYVFDGEVVAQADKLPAGDEIRVHGRFGGSTVRAAVEPPLAALAGSAVAAVGEVTGVSPAYARVDAMAWQGRWTVSEVELIEPGLYLDVEPANAGRFADLVLAHLGVREGG